MIGDRGRLTLRACGLGKTFDAGGLTVTAVRSIDLALGRGEFAAIVGPSGAGKSTLLHLLGGLERPTSGQIWLNGQRVDRLSQARWARLRRRQIGFVFQFASLISNMTVADNVELAALMGGASRKQARATAQELLTELGLADRGGAGPAQLTTDEQQRVALARAMAPRPALLLADEPTGSLDSTSAAAVLRLLRRRHADGQSILLVTHDSRLASAADRVISLFDGMITDDAPMPGSAAAPGLAARAGGVTRERPAARFVVPAVLRLRD